MAIIIGIAAAIVIVALVLLIYWGSAARVGSECRDLPATAMR